jgi:hypothetical protein
MEQRSQSITTGRGWTRSTGHGTRHTDAECVSHAWSETRTAGESYGISPGWSGTNHRYVHHKPFREEVKPILDELRDKIADIGGEATPDDWQWLRGQLRKLADRLATE